MATVMTMRVPDGAQVYDALNQEMGIQNDLPEGLVHHFAAKDGGDMIIFDVWESKEDFERFMNDRLMPAFEKVGGGPPPEGGPEPTFAELHNEFHK
jgi:heme-degrading monooxygenase HmoA